MENMELDRIVSNLKESSIKLNAARNKLRSQMNEIAGVSLDNFSTNDLMRYSDLFIKKYTKLFDEIKSGLK